MRFTPNLDATSQAEKRLAPFLWSLERPDCVFELLFTQVSEQTLLQANQSGQVYQPAWWSLLSLRLFKQC